MNGCFFTNLSDCHSRSNLNFRNKTPSKTELVMFSPPKKQLDHELKVKLDGKKLY